MNINLIPCTFGTLALLADNGYVEQRLLERFCELMGLDIAEAKSFIRAGFYRFSTAYPSNDLPRGEQS